jgi:hypothetical protein
VWHGDINLATGIYTPFRLLGKARAVDRLPILTEKAEQVKTGTDDLTAYLTENPLKPRQNPATSVRCGAHIKKDGQSVNPFDSRGLQNVIEMRPEGFEPPTNGLEIHRQEDVSTESKATYDSSPSHLTPQLTPDSPELAQIDTQSLPPELAEIVAAWPRLPEHIRQAIASLVNSVPAIPERRQR